MFPLPMYFPDVVLLSHAVTVTVSVLCTYLHESSENLASHVQY